MINYKYFFLPIVLFITGCANTPRVSKIDVETITIPVPIACKEKIPDVPDFKFDTISPDDTIFNKTKIILSDRKLHLGYEAQLLAALKACRQDTDK